MRTASRTCFAVVAAAVPSIVFARDAGDVAGAAQQVHRVSWLRSWLHLRKLSLP